MKTIDEIRKTRNLFIEAETDNAGMGGYYYDVISGKNLNFIFSYQMGWEHLSVSMPSKTPSWDQMCRMKDIFWNKDEACFDKFCIEHCKDIESLLNEVQKQKEVIDKAISQLGMYADILTNNCDAYSICVSLLDTLKRGGVNE